MKNYRYLIIGGGMTAAAAANAIHDNDPDGSIGIVSAEHYPPYDRPPLTKKLWTGKKEEIIWRDVEKSNIKLHLGEKIVKLDVDKKTATSEGGETYQFEKCLLATGGSPRKFPGGVEDILYFRTYSDYKRLRELTGKGKKFAVIGGGFIGSEIAAALQMNDQEVTMLFLEEGIGGRIFPEDLSTFLNGYYRNKGVKVVPEAKVEKIEKLDDKYQIRFDQGEHIQADYIIAGLGIEPNIKLAQDAGLKVENGVLVNDALQTSHKDIYAAGDVAEFSLPYYKEKMRFEHEDNANTMGKIAGQNMSGANEVYDYLPMFYSDMFDLGYEAVGKLDSRLETFENWANAYEKGIIFYREAGRVSGVLLWNVWDTVDKARDLIKAEGLFSEDALFRISNEWMVE